MSKIKNLSSYLTPTCLIFFVYLGVISCTKVVDVDVPNGGERLIIEASINWEKGTSGNEQDILLSLSTPYFKENKFTPAQGANVKVTNILTQDIFTFNEQEPGVYRTADFIPVIDATYTLEVVYDANTYQSTNILHGVSEIGEITQDVEEIFGSESIQVMVEVNDPANRENFYYNEFWSSHGDELLSREVENDALSDGNAVTFDYEDEDISAGEILNIRVYGIDEGYYNFMNLLLEQSEGDGGPFATIPAKLIGNCVNMTNPDKETLGFFRLSEYATTTYTVQ